MVNNGELTNRAFVIGTLEVVQSPVSSDRRTTVASLGNPSLIFGRSDLAGCRWVTRPRLYWVRRSVQSAGGPETW